MNVFQILMTPLMTMFRPTTPVRTDESDVFHREDASPIPECEDPGRSELMLIECLRGYPTSGQMLVDRRHADQRFDVAMMATWVF